MSSRGGAFARAGLLAAVVIAADQITKAIVRGEISTGERIDLFAGIDLVRVSNEGIAFGMLDEAGALVLVLAAVAFAGLLSYFLAIGDRPHLWIPIGLLAGGAIGNIIDRVHEGAVTDFIDPPSWPAFNLADIAITVGVIVLFLLFIFGDWDDEDEQAGEDAERPSGEQGEREPAPG